MDKVWNRLTQEGLSKLTLGIRRPPKENEKKRDYGRGGQKGKCKHLKKIDKNRPPTKRWVKHV